jgi:hypothetical protein
MCREENEDAEDMQRKFFRNPVWTVLRLTDGCIAFNLTNSNNDT